MELRRCGTHSVLPSRGLQAPAGSQHKPQMCPNISVFNKHQPRVSECQTKQTKHAKPKPLKLQVLKVDLKLLGHCAFSHPPTFILHLDLALTPEKAMAPHSSTLAWKIPRTEEPGRLQSMGSLRVGHDWATSLSLFTFMHWRRKWQATPMFLPGESQGRGSLVGCHLWGCTESDTTEVT